MMNERQQAEYDRWNTIGPVQQVRLGEDVWYCAAGPNNELVPVAPSSGLDAGLEVRQPIFGIHKFTWGDGRYLSCEVRRGKDPAVFEAWRELVYQCTVHRVFNLPFHRGPQHGTWRLGDMEYVFPEDQST